MYTFACVGVSSLNSFFFRLHRGKTHSRDSGRIKRRLERFVCSLVIASSDLPSPPRRRKAVAFIKVCIVLIFAQALHCLSLLSRCVFVRGPPKGFGIFAINGTLCFTDMTVDSLGRLWVG